MPTAKDLRGTRFGRLLVIERIPAERPKWRCVCDCGKETVAYSGNLKAGTHRSCGCLQREEVSARMTRHGKHQTPEYRVWDSAKRRCLNPRHRAYRHYGARGITMCSRWQESFAAFLEDMGPRPTRHHSLERIWNDGPYAPENCRWATRREQSRNSRQNRMITFDGETKPLMDWSEQFKIAYETLRSRLREGHSVEYTFTAPVQARMRHGAPR